MCVKKIEAFADSKGTLHVREDAALLAEIGIQTGFKPGDAAAVRNSAKTLIPLLQRFLELDAPVKSENKAAPETAEKDPLDDAYSGPSIRTHRELES